MNVSANVDLALTPGAAFDELESELSDALAELGLRLEPGPKGRVVEGDATVGQVVSWKPGKEIGLEWRPARWKPEEACQVEIRFEPVGDGARVTVEYQGWDRILEDAGTELDGWFAREIVAPLMRVTGSKRLGDWVTDRRARRPSGSQARATYRDPIYHWPNFRAILEVLQLRAEDFLLEIGCGGGAFLKEALRSGCRARAIDHSPEMVRLASEVNQESIANHRLEIQLADANQLPFPNGTFTCAVMTGVFNFLPDPVFAMEEIRRVLIPKGRFVMFAGAPCLRGTPAAPEPMASRLRFYERAEIERLVRTAGFPDVRVGAPDLKRFAEESGIPKEALEWFSGTGGFLTVAIKG